MKLSFLVVFFCFYLQLAYSKSSKGHEGNSNVHIPYLNPVLNRRPHNLYNEQTASLTYDTSGYTDNNHGKGSKGGKGSSKAAKGGSRRPSKLKSFLQLKRNIISRVGDLFSRPSPYTGSRYKSRKNYGTNPHISYGQGYINPYYIGSPRPAGYRTPSFDVRQNDRIFPDSEEYSLLKQLRDRDRLSEHSTVQEIEDAIAQNPKSETEDLLNLLRNQNIGQLELEDIAARAHQPNPYFIYNYKEPTELFDQIYDQEEFAKIMDDLDESVYNIVMKDAELDDENDEENESSLFEEESDALPPPLPVHG